MKWKQEIWINMLAQYKSDCSSCPCKLLHKLMKGLLPCGWIYRESIGGFMGKLSFGFPLVREFWSISTQKPAVIRKHWFIPAVLISPFHHRNILMEPFSVLITDSSITIWEKIGVGVGKMDFEGYVASELMVFLEKYCQQLTVVIISFVPLKFMHNTLESVQSFLLFPF